MRVLSHFSALQLLVSGAPLHCPPPLSSASAHGVAGDPYERTDDAASLPPPYAPPGLRKETICSATLPKCPLCLRTPHLSMRAIQTLQRDSTRPYAILAAPRLDSPVR